jgi:hypothetical protein
VSTTSTPFQKSLLSHPPHNGSPTLRHACSISAANTIRLSARPGSSRHSHQPNCTSNFPRQAAPEEVLAEKSPNIAVRVSTSFPSSEIFGIKLVNGRPTQALLSFSNDEPEPVTVAFIGGSLWGPDPKTQGVTDRVVRNITSTRFNVEIPAGEKESVSYSFATELHPQDLRLQLVAVVTDGKGAIYTLNAFNETVSVVEPDASLFDPQL